MKKQRKYIFVGKIISSFLIAALALGGMLIYSILDWVMDTWADVSMDEIMFHLKAPLEGTNEELINGAIERCVPSALLVFFLVFVILIGIKERRRIRWGTIAAITICSVMLSVNTLNVAAQKYNLKEYRENKEEISEFVTDYYVDPRKVELTFPEQKRNLIYIYLESMEVTYASKDEGGAFDDNYIPELTEIAKENISFSSNESLGGAKTTAGSGWTMGALFTQTSGIPLIVPVDGNSMNEQDSFFPDIATLGDVLDEAGYRQIFLIGSESEFGGRKNYFEAHGNYEMWDYNTAKEEGKIPEDYRVFWGYEDEKLFSYAQEQLLNLASGEEPFNFTMLTVDTHFEDGYVCNLCTDEFGDSQYANVIACSSRQVAEFLNWIKNQSFYENTTVIIAGDHLTMDSDFCADIADDYEREVYNAFINSAVTTTNIKNRSFTTLDMFPTTLASIGVQIEGEKLGLGTNLFAAAPTLAESVGLNTINGEMAKQSTFFDYLTRDIVIAEESAGLE